jgi:hypothetical protein
VRAFLAGRSGVSLVEFALIAPLLVLVFVGSIDTSRAVTAANRASYVADMIGELVSQATGTLSDETIHGLIRSAPLSVSWSALQSAAAGITLGPNNGGGTGDSFLAEPLADLRGRIPASGDGSTQAQARAFLFIITDGLRDVRGSCWGGHCKAAFDPAACQTYKDANITVGVIYTTYLPILKNPNIPSTGLLSEYQLLVQPHAAQIAPNLRACASPGWYAEASDGPSIDAALARMFDQTTLQARLTD